MSNSTGQVTAADIRALVESLERLTVQVSHLVSRFDSAPAGSSAPEPTSVAPAVDLGDWELVGEPALPFGFSTVEELSRLHQFHGPESGPPSTPEFLLDFACRELKGPSSACYRRASRAFVAGFWALVSTETQTPYRSVDPFGPPSKHWIILRYRLGSKPVRVARKCDFVKLVGNTPEDFLIAEEFALLAELAIFCAGAGIRVPPLQQWKGSN